MGSFRASAAEDLQFLVDAVAKCCENAYLSSTSDEELGVCSKALQVSHIQKYYKPY